MYIYIYIYTYTHTYVYIYHLPPDGHQHLALEALGTPPLVEGLGCGQIFIYIYRERER